MSTNLYADRGELTVHLEVRGEMLHRTVHTRWETTALPPEPLAAVGSAYAARGRTGLDALAHVLTDGTRETLEEGLSDPLARRAGGALFEVLFGSSKERWTAALRPLFPEGPVVPTRHPVRVRIWTDAPVLLGLPWGLTALETSYLRDHGWTFEVTDRREPSGDRRLRLPTAVLLILPGLRSGTKDEHRADLHRAALEEVFESYYSNSTAHPKQFVVAQTREEVVAALRDVRPQLVYFYGHGEARESPGLVIPPERPTYAGAHVWSAHDIEHAIRESKAPIELIYLNGCMTAQGGLQSVALRLLQVVPAVVAHATTAWSNEAGQTATRWLRRILGEEADPVVAAYVRDVDQPVRGVGWLPVVAMTRYRTFGVERRRPLDWRPRRGSDLDRHRQRTMVDSELRTLVNHPTRRGWVFLSFGPPGNHQGDVAGQLHRFAADQDVQLDLLLGEPIDVSPTLQRNVGVADERLLDTMAGNLNVLLQQEWETPLARTLLAGC